jgi:NADPH:quinone reductase-like Zn-dependent oxidoreductase
MFAKFQTAAHASRLAITLLALCSGLTVGMNAVGQEAVVAAAGEAATMRQYQLEAGSGGYVLALKTVPRPEAGPNEVLVRVRAASLNRRDVSILNVQYGGAGGGRAAGTVPLSDGAGEVVAVGPGVTRFAVGDRVAGIFFTDWIDGARDDRTAPSARGGGQGGMLSEYVLGHEQGFVEVPDYMSLEEAATLPCAGVTAWVALFRYGNLKRDEYVLLEGTGGVSVFGLQLAAAAGAHPIITSSSDEKLARATQLGAFGTVNYRSHPEWQIEVRELTGGRGVDHVLEVGGQDTLPKALEAMAFESHIALIGGLSGFATDVPLPALMGLGAMASGIYVGSRADFEGLNAFMAEHEIHPVIDRVFAFEEAPAAFDLMENGSFFGKIVIRL